MNQMPPRENPRINTSLESVYASGPLGRAHCVLHGNCNYKQTGALQAYAAYSLLQQPPRRVGSHPAARPSATANCWACCAASAWSSTVLTVQHDHASTDHASTDHASTDRAADGFLDKGASLGPAAAVPDQWTAAAAAMPRCSGCPG